MWRLVHVRVLASASKHASRQAKQASRQASKQLDKQPTKQQESTQPGKHASSRRSGGSGGAHVCCWDYVCCAVSAVRPPRSIQSPVAPTTIVPSDCDESDESDEGDCDCGGWSTMNSAPASSDIMQKHISCWFRWSRWRSRAMAIS